MGLGNLFGLLGGGHVGTNPYASQQSNAAASLGGVASGYGQFGQGELGQYDRFSPQYDQAVTQDARLLQSDPYTDSYSAGKIAQATGTTTAAYQSAKANLQAEMARRGISGGGAEVGGLAGIEASRAGAISGAANNVAMQSVQQRYQNADALTNLYSGATKSAEQGYLDALGGQESVYGQQAGIYGNLGSQWDNVQEYNGQADDELGKLAGTALTAYGRR